MLYDRINTELKRINNQIATLEMQLKCLPTGTLFCTKNGKYSKWYKKEFKNLQYIKKENIKLAEELALKKHLSLQIQDLLQEKEALTSYLKHHEANIEKAPRLLSDTSPYRALLTSQFSSYSNTLQDWAHMSYEKNVKFPEQLIHKSISGNILRSKSEVLIDMALYQNNIPFRYESPLTLNDMIIYPDFTIRHPVTGKLLYWEHFGLMDSPSYSKNTSNKLQLYISNGLIPSINLITTYETNDHPLTMELIVNIITYYFQ